MNTYKHTQPGHLILVILGGISMIVLVSGLTVSRPTLLAVPILAFCGWIFHSLTIEITADELRWHFGPGLIRKRVLLNQIASASVVRTNFLEGWGIHWSRYGWLYNISGFDAVAITLRNGKRFALGSDEPQALSAALQSRLTPDK
jgi:hypothetical protein